MTTEPTTWRTGSATSASSCRRGRSATRGRGSRCSPRRASRATPTRRSPTPPRCTRFTGVAPSVALHIPWDRVDDYGDAGQARRRPRRAHRHHQLQRLPGRRLHAGLGHQPGPAGPAEGHRPPARVRRHHGRHRVARPQAVVLRRHQLPRPGRHRGPSGPAGRGAGRGLRPPRRRPAVPARVQAVRAGLLHDGRARLGHGVRCTAWRSGRRRRS